MYKKIEQLFPNMPVRTVIQIWQNQGNKIVFLFVSALHYFVHVEEATNGFLADDVLAIS